MLDTLLNTLVYILAIYGMIEIIKTIYYIMECTKLREDGIYIIIATKNQANKIEGLLRSILFKIMYGKENEIKKVILTDLSSKDDTLKKLKKLGIKQVQYNLEIANKDLFTSTCPGKINYEEFVSKLYEAVNIFGKGNVRSNFVLGLQDYNELINECEKFAEKGIVADYSVFQPKKNTLYSNLEAPEMKDVINFTKRLVKIYVKYNQHPIFCSLSSRSSIVNEVYYDNVK